MPEQGDVERAHLALEGNTMAYKDVDGNDVDGNGRAIPELTFSKSEPAAPAQASEETMSDRPQWMKRAAKRCVANIYGTRGADALASVIAEEYSAEAARVQELREACKHNESCSHDEEPWYCVCCETDRERRISRALGAWEK